MPGKKGFGNTRKTSSESPVYKKKFGEPANSGAFKLKSGNSPLFKMMGSSPVKDAPHTVEHAQQIARARKKYRRDMPIVYKNEIGKEKKRREFVEDYMSKFEAPEYVAPEGEEEVVEEPVVEKEEEVVVEEPVEEEEQSYWVDPEGNKVYSEEGEKAPKYWPHKQSWE